MNRIIKKTDSEIISKNLKYSRNSKNNKVIRDILKEEQGNICAYTQSRINASFTVEIEHFNPTLKDDPSDNYYNWFAVSGQWNREKGSDKRWVQHQPILSPVANDFENRLKYKKGIYLSDETDMDTKNLIDYLNINQENLVADRINHIKLLKQLLQLLKGHKDDFIQFLNEHKNLIQYNRAIQEELHIRF